MLCAPGGRFLEVGDEKCTHLVVEENSVKELPFVPSKRLYVVKQEVSIWQNILSNGNNSACEIYFLCHVWSIQIPYWKLHVWCVHVAWTTCAFTV